MFNKEKNTPERAVSNSATLISAGTMLQGDINSENDLRIDGSVKGNIRCTAKIIIGPSGLVDGNIDGQQADITGKVIGNIVVKDLLQIKGQGYVQGNINAAKLQIDPTATFNGHCQMGTAVANIVQMSENEATTIKAKAK
jgi:cytoskeletal protein CcmA (bactofilin family)